MIIRDLHTLKIQLDQLMNACTCAAEVLEYIYCHIDSLDAMPQSPISRILQNDRSR